MTRFSGDILDELDRASDRSMKEQSRALYREIEMAFIQGGSEAVANLLREKQASIEEAFRANLGSLEGTL